MNRVEKLREDPRVTIRRASDPDPAGRCVVYWMQRSQRAHDNPALNIAIDLGNELRKPVVVFFAPVPFYPHANLRHYYFLAQGIADIADGLDRRGVGFVFRAYPDHSLLKFCNEVRPAIVVGDENPMREPESWRVRAAEKLRVPLWTVDSDVIVPSKLLGREHFAARTIRPRINELLPQFFVPLANPKAQVNWKSPKGLHTLSAQHDFLRDLKLDRSVGPVPQWRGGSKQALRILNGFVRSKLSDYPEDRNHPEADGTSRLSPYLHFGHIGPHIVATAVQKSNAPAAPKKAFLEQLIVRRELSVNFVRFNPHYDSMESREPWADRSLAEHARDRRPILYSEKQLENAETHDPLWNAAQKQMVLTGWMHNYLRMYWAKKILEWSPSIASAVQRAVYLNDRYELDGRDPNGYAGIAWAIVGKHDRAWSDRPIFGKIRYMSFQSTSRKFDSRRYIAQIEALAGKKNKP
ncbi:MAG TPA: deoxyribodipyrimidine photo-lyase [Terriglobales bacterium]